MLELSLGGGTRGGRRGAILVPGGARTVSGGASGGAPLECQNLKFSYYSASLTEHGARD